MEPLQRDNRDKFVFFLMIRRPPRSTQGRSSAASDVYKRQRQHIDEENFVSSTFFINYPNCNVSALAAELATDNCLLYTSPSPRDRTRPRMPSSA